MDEAAIPHTTEDLLASVARYRERWKVTGPDPLGEAATLPNHADEHAALSTTINRAVALRQSRTLPFDSQAADSTSRGADLDGGVLP